MRYGLIPLLFAFGCATVGTMGYTPPTHGDCSSGTGHDDNGSFALVCVNRDAATGDIHANPQRVHAKMGNDIYVMFSDGNGEIDVQFTATTPIYRNHHTNGSAAARSLFKAKARTHTTAWSKYRIVDRESMKDEDPEVMIDP